MLICKSFIFLNALTIVLSIKLRIGKNERIAVNGDRVSSLSLKDEDLLSKNTFEDIWGHQIDWMDPKDGKHNVKII